MGDSIFLIGFFEFSLSFPLSFPPRDVAWLLPAPLLALFAAPGLSFVLPPELLVLPLAAFLSPIFGGRRTSFPLALSESFDFFFFIWPAVPPTPPLRLLLLLLFVCRVLLLLLSNVEGCGAPLARSRVPITPIFDF